MLFAFSLSPRLSIKNELLAGITTSLALVPEVVAFSFVAGVNPIMGLYAAFIIGIMTSIFGGRPGMVSGAAGAMAVVVVSLVATHGIQYLLATVLLTGVLQILAGIFKLGKFIRMVPHPVMLGFVNGLAIVIFLAQLTQFKIPDMNGIMTWLPQEQIMIMLGLVVLTMAIVYFLPKLTKAVPASLAAIIIVTLVVQGFGLETRTVVDFLRSMSGDLNATLSGELPSFALPSVPLTFETLNIILPYALILAGVGLIESLLTLTVVDEMTETRGQSNRECIGQGMGNIACSLFGAMCGCAMIGQTMMNMNSGGRYRLSSLTTACMILIYILFAAALIEMIPLAALVGVMFMVVISTFEWATFKLARRVPKKDFFVILLVTAITVATDLAIAVAIGVIVSALIFAWDHAKRINAHRLVNEAGSKEYHIHGPLFFASVANFLELFDLHNDPHDVIVDFAHSRVADHSAIEAIENLAEKYAAVGKTLHLRHLSPDCHALLHKAGSLIEINSHEDPIYKVATDKLAG